MITLRNLAIFERFEGDDDGWSRAGCPGSEHFGASGWTDIRNLLQEVFCLRRGLVSAEYKARIETKLKEMTEGPDVIAALIKLAEQNEERK